MVFRGHVERERQTLTRLLQRHQGGNARDRKSKKHERSKEKINVSDDMRAGGVVRRGGGRRFTFYLGS